MTAAGDAFAAEAGDPVTYADAGARRTYLLLYFVAAFVLVFVSGAVGSVIVPNHVQLLVLPTVFTGADAGVDTAALANLRDAVAAGTANPTGDERRLLDLFARFDAARADALALVVGLGTLVTILVSPVIGELSDRTRSRLGRRSPWLLGGAVVGSAALLAMAVAPSIGVLALAGAVVLAVANVANTVLNTTVADRVPAANRGAASGVGGLGNFTGAIVGVGLAGVLFGSIALGTYVLTAVVLLAGIGLFVAGARDRSSADVVLPARDLSAALRGFVAPVRDHDYRLVWVIRAALFFGGSIALTLPFLMLQGYVRPAMGAAEATEATTLVAAAGLPLMLVAMSVTGWLSDRTGRRRPFVVAAAVVMAGSCLVPLASPTLEGVLVQAAVSGLALGIYLPVDQALFIDVLPDRHAAGRDLGTAAIAVAVGQAAGPIVAAQAVGWTGGYAAVWVAGVVAALGSGLLVTRIRGVR